MYYSANRGDTVLGFNTNGRTSSYLEFKVGTMDLVVEDELCLRVTLSAHGVEFEG